MPYAGRDNLGPVHVFCTHRARKEDSIRHSIKDRFLNDHNKHKPLVCLDDSHQRQSALATLLIAGMLGHHLPGPMQRRKVEKTLKECALPGCDTMTAHNGGYCSPEHCKKHRSRQHERTAYIV